MAKEKPIVLTESIYYILLSLKEPLHGYGIMQNIKELTGGRINMAPGTLYGALTNLLDKGWIRVISDGGEKGKKEYQLTPAGIQVLKQEYLRLGELVAVGKHVLGGTS